MAVLLPALMALAAPAMASDATASDATEGADEVSVDTSVSDPLAYWRETSVVSDGLTLYRPNYLLPVSWAPDPDADESRTEIQFQLSLLLQVLDTPIYFAYTQTAFWDAYDGDDSRPFREMTFNPELFFRLPGEYTPSESLQIEMGWDHTSNGQSGEASRGWDRGFVRLEYAAESYRVRFSVWDVLNPSAQVARDNPDILDYYGYQELQIDWQMRRDDRISLMNRHNFSSGKGANRLRYSVPTGGEGFWFLQIFNGYGESLIDYDRNVTRIGLGWALSR